MSPRPSLVSRESPEPSQRSLERTEPDLRLPLPHERTRAGTPATPPARTARTSGIQVSPGSVTRPHSLGPRGAVPMPRPTAMPRSTPMPRPTPAQRLVPTSTRPRPGLCPRPLPPLNSRPLTTECETATAPVAPSPARARESVAPAHSERRWSEPPTASPLSHALVETRGESTLVVAARTARHSDVPPPIADSAAQFLPFYWRLWLALTA